MLKIAEGINLEELEKYGFKEICIIGEWCYRKEYIDCEYEEHITIWIDRRTVHIKAFELLDTLYDLIQAGIVVKE